LAFGVVVDRRGTATRRRLTPVIAGHRIIMSGRQEN